MHARSDSRSSFWPEDTPGVHHLSAIGPLAAELGLGGAAVAPLPSVEYAVDLVIVEKSAGGDDLGTYRKWALPLHLAEVRGLARPDQRLQSPLPSGAHDLNLKVAAAGGSSSVVCGPAGGPDAGIGSCVHRQLSGRTGDRQQHPGDEPAFFHHPEPIAPKSARCRQRRRPGPIGAVETKGLAALAAIPIGAEQSAGNVKGRLHVEVLVVLPQVREKRNIFGVADQPGCLLVSASRPGVQAGDPEHDMQRAALGPHGAAGRCARGMASWHPAKIPDWLRPVALRRSAHYICELIHKAVRSRLAGAFGGKFTFSTYGGEACRK